MIKSKQKLLAFILTIFLALSFFTSAYFLFTKNIEQIQQEKANELKLIAEEITLRTKEVLKNHDAVLQDIKNTFINGEIPTEEEWKNFWNQRKSSHTQFGLTARGLAKHEGEINDQNETFKILYVEPYESNKAAINFDLLSNPERKETITLARDTNSAINTAPIILVTETESKKGFIKVIPIYKDNKSDTLKDRQENIATLATIAVQAEGLFKLVIESLAAQIDENIEITVTDITNKGTETLLPANTIKGILKSQEIPFISESQYQPLDYSTTIQQGSRIWKLEFKAPAPIFFTIEEQLTPLILLIFGIIISILIGVTIYASINLQTRAEEIAKEKTQELESTNELFSIATSTANIGAWKWNLQNNTITWTKDLYKMHEIPESTTITPEIFTQQMSAKDKIQFKKDIQNTILKGTAQELPEREYKITLPSGQKRFFYTVGKITYDKKEKPHTLFGIMQDITLRHLSEKKLKEQKDQVEKMNELMIGRELQMTKMKQELNDLKNNGNNNKQE